MAYLFLKRKVTVVEKPKRSLVAACWWYETDTLSGIPCPAMQEEIGCSGLISRPWNPHSYCKKEFRFGIPVTCVFGRWRVTIQSTWNKQHLLYPVHLWASIYLCNGKPLHENHNETELVFEAENCSNNIESKMTMTLKKKLIKVYLGFLEFYLNNNNINNMNNNYCQVASESKT